MECPSIQKNMEHCNCTYAGCPRMGKCCECVSYHRAKQQLPACFFDKEAAATWDRSYARFARLHS